MILDAESLELVNAIESMLEPAPVGEIKPELMESVLEVSTDPCRNTAEAGDQLRALRAQVRETAARKNLTIGSAGTHPFAMWEDQRIVARPRYRDLVSALRFVARQELIFGMHVHVAVDDPEQGDPRRQRDARARPDPARAVGELPVLARRGHRAGLDPDADLPGLPADGDPADVQGLGGLRGADRVHGQRARDRGLHVPVARRAAAPQLRDGRDPRDGLPDARRAHARDRRAGPGPRPRAVRALRRRQAAVALPVRDARREQVAGGAPRPRGRARRPARSGIACRRGSSPAG